MSLFSAINTAVSGLTAQSTAFGNISEDVANSQTVGFKRVDTSFVDYLTTSTSTINEPGAVVAHPSYVNNIQGAITQTDNPLGMAIAGQGFFAVSQPIGTSQGVTTYNPLQFYSRVGDFSMNAGGFLVNSAGQYLNGWTVDPTTKAVDQNALVPIQVNQETFNPLPTSNVTLAANLPAKPAAGTATAASPLSSQITVYDALGEARTVNLNWSQTPDPTSLTTPPAVLPNTWTVQVQVPDATKFLANGTTPNYTNAGTATVTFGAPTTKVPPAGTIASVTPALPPTVVAGTPSAAPATDSITVNKNADGTVANFIETDTTTGTVVSTTTFAPNVISAFPIGGVPGTPGVPIQSIAPFTPTTGTATVAGGTWTKSTAADGTITFANTVDTGTLTLPLVGTNTVTTYTIPPGGTLGGGGSYITGATTATPATLNFTTDFGSGNQSIQLNLGDYGGTSGVTQFAGSTYSLLGLTQDGVPPGSFSGVTAQANGNVVVNYNNGQTKTIAQIPLVTFNAPNSLQSQNGQSFTATPSSGSPLAEAASTNGAGNLVTGSVEGSNVNIATEFTSLIVAQQSYSSNAKVVTTANQMLQATLQMIA
jgi:flagellar hook protein FlgE